MKSKGLIFDIKYFQVFDMEYLIFVMKSRDLITCWSYVRLYIQSLCHVKGNHLNEHVVCNKSIDLKTQALNLLSLRLHNERDPKGQN